MARLLVSRDSFSRGEFPPVCCKTGVRAETFTRWQFHQVPGWTWILLPFGILPWLIARLLVVTTFDGVLPISEPAQTRLRRLRVLRVVLALAALALVTFGAFTFTPSLVWIGIAAAALWLATLLLGLAWSPDAKIRDDEVQLRNVHPEFVSAVRAARAPGHLEHDPPPDRA